MGGLLDWGIYLLGFNTSSDTLLILALFFFLMQILLGRTFMNVTVNKTVGKMVAVVCKLIHLLPG